MPKVWVFFVLSIFIAIMLFCVRSNLMLRRRRADPLQSFAGSLSAVEVQQKGFSFVAPLWGIPHASELRSAS